MADDDRYCGHENEKLGLRCEYPVRTANPHHRDHIAYPVDPATGRRSHIPVEWPNAAWVEPPPREPQGRQKRATERSRGLDRLRDRLDGEAARDEGMERVDEAADDAWKARAYAVLIRVAVASAEFTSDDLWAAGLDHPTNSKALGPVMAKGARAGIMEKSGREKTTDQATRQAGLARIWKSLIYAPRDD